MPIESSALDFHPFPSWELAREVTASQGQESVGALKENVGAEEEVASLWYQSSLKSMAEPEKAATATDASVQIEKKSVVRQYLGRAKEWLWNLFGWSEKAQETESSENSPVATIGDLASPRLSTPEYTDKKRLKNTLAELNREFVYRLKDISEFEEEMRRSSSNQLDKLIFLELIYSSLLQKQLKEESGEALQQELLKLHRDNEKLRETHYNLLDEINNRAKTQSVLHWTNIGLTVGLMGGIAAGFFTGGASLLVTGIISGGTGLASLAKGGTTLLEGHLKYKNDLKTGELFVINRESKANSKRMDDEIGNLQEIDEDIGAMLKMIRQHLDNQSQAERASFGRNT